ncbi:hypothetical protein H2P46_12290 [Mixta sp. Marseille-Q2057]|nr:hypothetical protein [Mixta mediterraneensis]
MFKPDNGPSSSHTVSPMKAGKRFTDALLKLPDARALAEI